MGKPKELWEQVQDLHLVHFRVRNPDDPYDPAIRLCYPEGGPYDRAPSLTPLDVNCHRCLELGKTHNSDLPNFVMQIQEAKRHA